MSEVPQAPQASESFPPDADALSPDFGVSGPISPPAEPVVEPPVSFSDFVGTIAANMPAIEAELAKNELDVPDTPELPSLEYIPDEFKVLMVDPVPAEGYAAHGPEEIGDAGLLFDDAGWVIGSTGARPKVFWNPMPVANMPAIEAKLTKNAWTIAHFSPDLGALPPTPKLPDWSPATKEARKGFMIRAPQPVLDLLHTLAWLDRTSANAYVINLIHQDVIKRHRELALAGVPFPEELELKIRGTFAFTIKFDDPGIDDTVLAQMKKHIELAFEGYGATHTVVKFLSGDDPG